LAKNVLASVAGAPLPLKLRSWQANFENNGVKLAWSTASEEMNTSFEVQRSEDGRTFQTIFQTRGTGKDSDYSWMDLSPLPNRSFYRLKITEAAKTSYSGVIPINNTDKKSLIAGIFSDASRLHVQINSNSSKDAVLTIINYSGALIKSLKVKLAASNSMISIPISELAAGEYFLRITTSDNSTVVERFRKMK
jgi:hypothetical protein